MYTSYYRCRQISGKWIVKAVIGAIQGEAYIRGTAHFLLLISFLKVCVYVVQRDGYH